MKEVEVIVGKEEGDKGSRYYFCFTKDDTVLPKGTVITFSTRLWMGEIPPEKGQSAILGEVRKFPKGWRANKARPISL